MTADGEAGVVGEYGAAAVTQALHEEHSVPLQVRAATSMACPGVAVIVRDAPGDLSPVIAISAPALIRYFAS